MLKVVIVTDGHYSAAFRAYKHILAKYETKYMQLDPPEIKLADEIKLDSKILEDIRSDDLLLSYIRHPDLSLELIDRVYEDLKWIIVATWYGEGFKKQLLGYQNVKVAETNNYWDKANDKSFDEFITHSGNIINRIYCEGTKIVGI
ncbi:DUF166 family protein [Methanobacterium sp. ACI-7]|uniref:DUF166 family protein n=1 Tax=unclassified Methanobacterium TaxID=2627676 RepID=UPI0039C23E76